MKPILAAIAEGRVLSEEEATAAFNIIMSGEATPTQIGALLMGLRQRGETVDEITGAVRAMRARMVTVNAPDNAIDIVGTGGDGSGSYNISTAAALVVAGAGVPVAKHGNRAASSQSGTADIQAALGVNLDADMSLVEDAIREAGVGFLFAPRHHSAMRHVGPARSEMAIRTIFNILGPLCNPAAVKRQLTGVFDARWVIPMAEALGRLGSGFAWVVHGLDGMDELTTTGPSLVAELRDGKVSTFEIKPADADIASAKTEDLKGGTPAENAAALVALLAGAPGPYRDIVILNTAGALVVAGTVRNLAEGAEQAARSIDSGAAKEALDKLVEITNRSGH